WETAAPGPGWSGRAAGERPAVLALDHPARPRPGDALPPRPPRRHRPGEPHRPPPGHADQGRAGARLRAAPTGAAPCPDDRDEGRARARLERGPQLNARAADPAHRGGLHLRPPRPSAGRRLGRGGDALEALSSLPTYYLWTTGS